MHKQLCSYLKQSLTSIAHPSPADTRGRRYEKFQMLAGVRSSAGIGLKSSGSCGAQKGLCAFVEAAMETKLNLVRGAADFLGQTNL